MEGHMSGSLHCRLGMRKKRRKCAQHKPKGLTVSLSICGNAQCDQETKVSVRAWERSFSSKWHVAKNLVGKLEKLEHNEDGTEQNIENLAAARAQCIFNALGFEILAHECNRATSLGFETI